MKINEGITLNRKLLDKTLSYSLWDSSSGRKRAEFAMFLTVCKSHTCMKHVVISIKSLHDLRQIIWSSASSYVPCCVKSCTNLHQKACCFASSCNCTLLFLCCHLSFSIFFSDIFRFLFSCFLFFNPRFFQMFFDKVCIEIIYLWFSHSCFYKLNSHGFYILKCRAMLVEWVSVLSYHRISEYNLGRECLKQLINMIRLLLIPFRHSLYPKTSEHQEMLHHSLFW